MDFHGFMNYLLFLYVPGDTLGGLVPKEMHPPACVPTPSARTLLGRRRSNSGRIPFSQTGLCQLVSCFYPVRV